MKAWFLKDGLAVWITAVATVTAVIFAVIIGFTQNNINQKLIDFNLRPLVDLHYDGENKNLVVENNGETIFYLEAIKDDSELIRIKPMRLMPKSNYAFPILEYPRLKFLINNKVDGDYAVFFDLFIKNSSEEYFVVQNVLRVQIEQGTLNDVRVSALEIQRTKRPGG